MKKSTLFFLMLALPAFLFVSCSKDNDMDDEPEYFLPLSAERTAIVNIPAGLKEKSDNGDLNALTAIAYMGLANTISGFSGSFMLPPDAKIQNNKNNSNVYYWSMGGYSYWMTYSMLPDKYTWSYDYEFPEKPRFTYIYAEESKSGNEGSWVINNPNVSGLKLWNYEWNINPLSTFYATIKLNDTGSSNEGFFEVISNANNSGSFLYEIETVKQAEVIWNANGSGTYMIWNGSEEKTGFWN